MEKKIINAKILKTKLGIERGLFTYMLIIEHGSVQQGTGGNNLGYLGAGIIRRILEVVGVSDWADLAGQYVRVERMDTINSGILRIGNILKDDWIDFATIGDDVVLKVREALGGLDNN